MVQVLRDRWETNKWTKRSRVEVRSDFRFRVLVHVLKVMVALKLIFSGRFYLYLGDNNSDQNVLAQKNGREASPCKAANAQ